MFEELLQLYKTKAEVIERNRKEIQAMITMVSAIEKMSQQMCSKQNDVELLGRLIDQVDRLSKEVTDLKSQFKTRQVRATPAPITEQNVGERKALDNHARSLIEIMAERPGQYTTSELVDKLGLNKTTVISVMKRALEIDPKHVKMAKGKRRKLYLSYIAEENGHATESSGSSTDPDRIKLELMAMT